MFKHLAKLSFILLISVSLIITSLAFAKESNQDETEDLGKIIIIPKGIQEALLSQVMLRVYIPMREGRDDPEKQASGTVIFEGENRVEDFNGKVIKYKTYYILSTDHVVSQIQLLLEKYEEAGIRIFVQGKKDTIQAHVIAWEWGSTALLLRIDVPEDELDNFKFKAAKIAKELPVSAVGHMYSDKDVDIVYLSGYPLGFLIANPGYVSTYLYNYNFNSYTRLVKAAAIDVPGLSWRGPGQSGAGVFNQKGELVAIVIGRFLYQGASLTFTIPIDVVVERFLRKLPELKGLNLPKFDLEEWIKNKPNFLGRPKNVTINQDGDNSKN